MSRADRPRVTRRFLGSAIVAAFLAGAGAGSAPAASLHAAFSPDRLGAPTTITVGFHVGNSAGYLTRVGIDLPSGVTAGFNGLGVASCTETQLQSRGPGGCPRNALIGRGQALVSVPLGSQQLVESVHLTVFMAPAAGETTSMVFYASGTAPVISQMIFQGSFLGDSGPFGAQLDTVIPPLPGLPGSPAAALVSMRTQLGPQGLRYYKREHGVTVAYTPEGFTVPSTCPQGGFPFAATFVFSGGGEESASTRAPCATTRSR